MQTTINFLEAISERVGRLAAWSTALMVAVIFFLVVMRYGFGSFNQQLGELTTYFFALSFLFSSGYALKHDSHVRVDLFYAKWSERRRAWVDLLGTAFFLLPWCLVAIFTCWKYAYNSFKLGEVSSQPSGLPAVWVLKFIILFGFVLLLIQGLALALRSVQTLRQR
ncbi:TRAP transporter small permease subunit [Neolewinella antarctica]|uniref:TRAP-type mannitol/chloroaromatic compound transport system permease small subunit n=1 Tax=Neolewinella antarctica TaxID=442734 RepID=A0ABX0XA63_9BACT|nr:TRAP transporter small permease subunit [Neolewinella antarctica]NJC25940.1 TRAP-type mannitol/chloroaromatic compound transport system permease small subunit [Neolewinella antarctica]